MEKIFVRLLYSIIYFVFVLSNTYFVPSIMASNEQMIEVGNTKEEPASFEELYYEKKCVPLMLEYGDCARHFYWGGPAHGIENQQRLVYITKFLPSPILIIKDAELNKYILKANKNDISAILALYRYYKNPDSPIFSDFEDEAYDWLLKAVKLGSKEAMLEMGLNVPYASVTSIKHDQLSASITANCEGIDRTGARCFLYLLKISDSGKTPNYYPILDSNYKLNRSIKPRQMHIIKNNKKLVLELISYNDDRSESRKDFFSQSGEYLGADKESATLEYFYNFSRHSPLIKQKIWHSAKKNHKMAEIDVNYFPDYERFALEEKKRKEKVKSLFNPSFTLSQNDGLIDNIQNSDMDYFDFNADIANRPFLKLKADELANGINTFKYIYGYDPAIMPNIVYYGNLSDYIEKAKNGDTYSFYLVKRLWFNPYSFVYKLPYPNDLIEVQNIYDYDIKSNNLTYFNQPYIVKTEINSDKNYLIEILALCEGFDNKERIVGATNCYAFQVNFCLESEIKTYYLLNEKLLYDTSKGHFNDLSFRHVFFEKFIYENNMFFKLHIYDGGHTPQSILYFDNHANYIFSDDIDGAASNYIMVDDNLHVNYYKNMRMPKFFNSRDSISITDTYYVGNAPDWDDITVNEMKN